MKEIDLGDLLSFKGVEFVLLGFDMSFDKISLIGKRIDQLNLDGKFLMCSEGIQNKILALLRVSDASKL